MRKEIESRSDCPTVAFARFVPRTRDSDPCPAWRCRLVRGHRCPEPPLASARGSGPGCQPFGWGTGSAHFWPRNDVCRLWHHRPIGRGTRGAYRCEARPNSIWVRASRNTRPQWFVGSCIVNWTGASIDQNVQRFLSAPKPRWRTIAATTSAGDIGGRCLHDGTARIVRATTLGSSSTSCRTSCGGVTMAMPRCRSNSLSKSRTL